MSAGAIEFPAPNGELGNTTALTAEALTRYRQSGDEFAQKELWVLLHRYRAELINQAFAVLGRVEDAEDVVQESFCQAMEGMDSLRDPQKVGRWLRKINQHNALRLYRWKRKEYGKTNENVDDQFPAPETTASGQNAEVAERVSNAERVARSIETLPEPFRIVVVMRYWDKASYEEIAGRLQIPLGTVKSRLARGENMLAKVLKRVWS